MKFLESQFRQPYNFKMLQINGKFVDYKAGIHHLILVKTKKRIGKRSK